MPTVALPASVPAEDPPTPAPRPLRVLVLVAHPDLARSRVHHALMVAAAAAANDRPGRVDIAVRDLYALHPDYLVDAAAEREALATADRVVWQHPLHWYGPTPLLKLWMDEVLSFGWAYGPGGHALRGKSLWLVTSTGGTAESYRPDGHHRQAFDAFLPPYAQTAALCGMRFERPWVIHGAHRLDDATIARLAAEYAARLLGPADLDAMADEGPGLPDVPAADRPAG